MSQSTRTCTIDGCTKPLLAKGMCAMHRWRTRKHGDPHKGSRAEWRASKQGRTCTLPGCDKPYRGRGYCQSHYMKWYETGDPHAAGRQRNYKNPEDAFAARTERQGDCLIWIGSTSNGYGMLRVGNTNIGAHRYAWLRKHGELPEQELDHICHNRACVEVAHLRLATRAQNMRNLSGAMVSNRVGVRGVSPTKYGRFIARVTKDSVTHYLGTFSTIEEAGAAVQHKRAELFGEFAGNK